MPDVTVVQWDLQDAGAAAAQMLQGAGASVRTVPFAAGQAGVMHSHPHEQFVIFLSGAGTLTSELGETEIRPGTVLHFAPNAPHQARFRAAGVLLEVNLRE